MSIIDEVLLEEYERSIRISRALENENRNLPKGSIQKKRINNNEYYYLMFRDQGKVISQYVAETDVDKLARQIALRKENQKLLKEQEQSRKKIVKALGREYIDEHSTERI
ncbi:MAG: hypothetical protein Q4C46_09885 [Bacillota bacterium]|nr:hypothetical protein [Bacillota bacterium]